MYVNAYGALSYVLIKPMFFQCPILLLLPDQTYSSSYRHSLLPSWPPLCLLRLFLTL